MTVPNPNMYNNVDPTTVRAISWGALIAGRVTRWPTPTPRPYVCHRCGVDYSDERALGWHCAGQHPATFDDASGRAGS